jgi:hypothetical protein
MRVSYTRKIIVSNTREAAYQALTTGYVHWWTTDCNSISRPGDEITFRFGPTYWTMRAINLIPNELVELTCLDAHHEHSGLDSSILQEWKDTKLIWEISKEKDSTQIILTHKGLVPTLNCYEICEQGWDYFFAESLKNYLNTGEGSPYNNEED